MNSFNKIKRVAGVLCGLLLAVSCSKEETSYLHLPTGTHPVTFTSDGVTSRADALPQPDAGYEFFPEGSSIGVFAYTLPDGVFDEDNSTPDLLYNASLTKLPTGGYLYNPVAHWPASGKVRFAAYYPCSHSLEPGTITVTPFTASGLPEITVDLKKTKGKLDFSVAVLDPIAPIAGTDPVGTPTRNDYSVNFRFKRKISELFFRARVVDIPLLTNLYINAISIKNIYTKGVYNMKSDSWSYAQDVDGVSGATIAFGSSGTPVNTEGVFTDIISPGNETLDNRESSLVMFPQTYENVELSILYTLEYLKADGGCEYRIIGTKKIPISIKWEAAKMYVYDLEFGFYEILGEKVPFKLTVKDWVKKEIGTTID